MKSSLTDQPSFLKEIGTRTKKFVFSLEISPFPPTFTHMKDRVNIQVLKSAQIFVFSAIF